ncbi:MAG: hypothetical protein RLZZ200_689, partial [Pseudomonadota bacterium]
MTQLCEKLDASRATITRLIAFLRDEQQQDIRYDREHNGYLLHRDRKTTGTAALLNLSSAEAAS